MMDGGEGERSAARYYEVGEAGGFALGLEALGGESQAELDLHAARGLDEGVVALDVLDDFGHGHGAAGLVGTRMAEDVADDALEVHGGLVLGVGALQGRHFLIAEPVALAPLHLALQLGIELAVVDGRFVVYELPLGNFDAEEASAAGGVVQGMAVVGGRHEAGVAQAVLLRLAVDGASVDAALGEELLELCLLAASHLIQLVDVHEQVVGQRHLLVELVGEVHVVQEVHAQLLGQQPSAEGGLAASLPSDEGGHHLVAVEAVLLHPVGHHAAHPQVHPVALLGAEAGQAVEECIDVVLAIPLGTLIEPGGDGVVVGDQAGLDDGLHLVAHALAVGQRFLGGEDEAVQVLHGEDPEFLLRLLLVSTTRAEFCLSADDVAAKLVVRQDELLCGVLGIDVTVTHVF